MEAEGRAKKAGSPDQQAGPAKSLRIWARLIDDLDRHRLLSLLRFITLGTVLFSWRTREDRA